MSPRPIWKGVLQLGLVRIPIKVFPATEASESLSFNQLHDVCQSRMQQKRWCPSCNREVPSAEIVKGYEFEKGRYVILLPEELDAVQVPSMKVIDLVRFTGDAALAPLAIDKAYYLAPDGGPMVVHAYAVLRDGMAGTVGVGKLAIYGREFLVAVRPWHHTLMLFTLHHAAEVRGVDAIEELGAIPVKAAGDDVKLVRQLVEARRVPETDVLQLVDFHDEYRDGVQRLIAAKIAGEEIVDATPVESPPVLQLRAALEQSLAATRVPESKRRKRAS